MFQGIADFINKILAMITAITNASTFASNPIGSVFGQSNTDASTAGEESDKGTKTLPEETEPTKVPEQSITRKKRAFITLPTENITARFNDTGSPAWKNQPGGKHLGTDFGAPNGSAVYAPYAMHIIKLGIYTDEGRKGEYIIGTLDDGTQYYSGHLLGTRVKVGEYVPAGYRIASIGYYNHTHVQLRVNNQLYDFEQYEKNH